ncbi:uncharacterized protein LOC132690490 [Panthera onca]
MTHIPDPWSGIHLPLPQSILRNGGFPWNPGVHQKDVVSKDLDVDGMCSSPGVAPLSSSCHCHCHFSSSSSPFQVSLRIHGDTGGHRRAGELPAQGGTKSRPLAGESLDSVEKSAGVLACNPSAASAPFAPGSRGPPGRVTENGRAAGHARAPEKSTRAKGEANGLAPRDSLASGREHRAAFGGTRRRLARWDRPRPRRGRPTAASAPWVLRPFPWVPEGGSRDPPMGDRAQRRGQPGSAGCGGRGGAGPGRESPRSPGRRQRGQRPGAERHGTERPRAPEPPGASLQAPPQRTAVRPAPRRRVRVAQGPGQPPADASRGGPASRSRRRRGRPGKLSPRHPRPGRRDPEVAPRCPDLPARRPHVSRSRRAGPLHLALRMWANGLQGPELASARPGGGGPARA